MENSYSRVLKSFSDRRGSRPAAKRRKVASTYSCNDLDEECLARLDELDEVDRDNLLDELQEFKHEIKNPSSWLFSKARTILSGNAQRAVGRNGGGLSKRDGYSRQTWGEDIAKDLKGLRRQGVDEAAINKLRELSAGDQEDLIKQFNVAYDNDEVSNPSAWLFKAARSILSSRDSAPNARRSGAVLRQLKLDPDAQQKLDDLEVHERAELVADFERLRGTVHNPSAWFQSKTRSILAAKASFRKAPTASVKRGRTNSASLFDDADLDLDCLANLDKLERGEKDDLLAEFNEIKHKLENPSGWLYAASGRVLSLRSRAGAGSMFKGVMVDAACLANLHELTSQEYADLSEDFEKQRSAIQNPSKWLYAAAGRIIKQRQASPHSGPLAKRRRLASMDHCTDLDEECLAKLDELEDLDRDYLLGELEELKHEIRNPSSWLFSKARTILSGNAPRADNRRGCPPAMWRNATSMYPRDELDEECLAKLDELDEVDRDYLLGELEEFKHDIRNRSKWLYSKARTILSGNAPGAVRRKSGDPSKRGGSSSQTSSKVIAKSLDKLRHQGVDEDAINKLRELRACDREDLIMQFNVACDDGEISNPSAWLFKATRSILSRQAKEKLIEL